MFLDQDAATAFAQIDDIGDDDFIFRLGPDDHTDQPFVGRKRQPPETPVFLLIAFHFPPSVFLHPTQIGADDIFSLNRTDSAFCQASRDRIAGGEWRIIFDGRSEVTKDAVDSVLFGRCFLCLF